MISPHRDERLAALLAGLVEQAREGRAADVEAAARENPDLAVELRELWAVAGMADELASGDDADSAATFPAGAGVALHDEAADKAAIAGQFGGYELIAKIGEGGMGVVYKARQKSLGRIVALKMIQRGALASAADVTRFRAEAAAAAHLRKASRISA
jgi:serine/threonine-protein kinase